MEAGYINREIDFQNAGRPDQTLAIQKTKTKSQTTRPKNFTPTPPDPAP
jgi:hypothetical protein